MEDYWDTSFTLNLISAALGEINIDTRLGGSHFLFFSVSPKFHSINRLMNFDVTFQKKRLAKT